MCAERFADRMLALGSGIGRRKLLASAPFVFRPTQAVETSAKKKKRRKKRCRDSFRSTADCFDFARAYCLSQNLPNIDQRELCISLGEGCCATVPRCNAKYALASCIVDRYNCC